MQQHVAIVTPAQSERRISFDAQDLSGCDRGERVIAPPHGDARRRPLHHVAFVGLRRAVKDRPVLERAQQLDVLAVRPRERHRRA